MKINQHNYEAWFLDYHEGRLTADQEGELLAFLSRHPRLRQEFDDYVAETLAPDHSTFMPEADSLKKSLMDFSPLEGRMIALTEGDLDRENEKALLDEISLSEEDKLLLEKFRKTKLSPDTSITFSDAAALKKPVIILWQSTQRIAAVAAAVLILIGIASLFLFRPWTQDERESLAVQSIEKKNPEILSVAIERPSLKTRTSPIISSRPMEREEMNISRINPLTNSMVEDHRSTAYSTSILLARISDLKPYYSVSQDELIAQGAENRTLAGKVISGFFNKLSAPFNTSHEKAADRDRKVTFWDFAELGVKSFNVLGDHEYTLVKEYNDKGNVKGVMLLEE